MISLFAGDERARQQQKLGDPLELLDRHVDFTTLARAVDAKLRLVLLLPWQLLLLWN